MKLKKNRVCYEIRQEFKIIKLTYYRFIVREHVSLLKKLPKLNFLLIIFYVLTVFILFD